MYGGLMCILHLVQICLLLGLSAEFKKKKTSVSNVPGLLLYCMDLILHYDLSLLSTGSDWRYDGLGAAALEEVDQREF